jgi:hypothetical protein
MIALQQIYERNLTQRKAALRRAAGRFAPDTAA